MKRRWPAAIGLGSILLALLWTPLLRMCDGAGSSPGERSDALAFGDASAPRLTCTAKDEGVPLGAYEGAVFGTAIVRGKVLVVGAVLKDEQLLLTFPLQDGVLKAPSKIVIDKVHGDAPPPRPLDLGGELAVAWFASGKGRVLRIAEVSTTLGKFVVDVPMGDDDSFAFDVGGAITAPWVVWDDAENGRGVIRVQHGSAERTTASPDTSDAESPIFFMTKAGPSVGWLSERVQRARDGGVAHDLEGPAEDRASRWIELATLDGAGVRQGDPVVVGSTTGHIQAFAILPDEARGVRVIAAEETERSEGEGGRIVRYRVREKAVEPAEELLPRGFGRANFDVFKGAGSPWIVFEDVAGRSRVGRFVDDQKIVWDGADGDQEGATPTTTHEIGRFLAEDGDQGLLALSLVASRVAVSRFRCVP